MMINKNKSYIGSYPSEELAARIYDILALKNRGIKARTNFIYNRKQIQNICEKEIDIKAENISEIISQLIQWEAKKLHIISFDINLFDKLCT